MAVGSFTFVLFEETSTILRKVIWSETCDHRWRWSVKKIKLQSVPSFMKTKTISFHGKICLQTSAPPMITGFISAVIVAILKTRILFYIVWKSFINIKKNNWKWP